MAISLKALEKAIIDNRGNLSAVARAFGVTRGAVGNRVAKSDTLKKAVREARDMMVDRAEDMLYDRMQDSDTLLIFYLKTQGGYIETSKVQHTGARDQAITIQLSWGDSDDNPN